MPIIIASKSRFVQFSASVPTQCPQGRDGFGPILLHPQGKHSTWHTVGSQGFGLSKCHQGGQRLGEGTAVSGRVFQELLSPNTEAPLVTSGKNRPLDLLLDKGLGVTGGSQRDMQRTYFPRTVGGHPSMDLRVLGYLLMALEHLRVRQKGVSCVPTTPCYPGSGPTRKEHSAPPWEVQRSPGPARMVFIPG